MESLLKEKSDKKLEKMYTEIYNKHFAGHDVFSFEHPNKEKAYVFKVDLKRNLWQVYDNGYFRYILFNNLLTDEEIKKCMVIVMAANVTGDTRMKGKQKMEQVARVAAEMGTTKEDIMSVYETILYRYHKSTFPRRPTD